MTTKVREAYRKCFDQCQMPNCPYAARDVHEILRGIHKREAEHHRTALLLLCRNCHDAVGDYSRWPIAKQLALKLLVDPNHFDLATIIEIRGNGPKEFEMSDIVKHLKMRT